MTTNIIKLSLFSALLSASLVAGSASAASKCKGLENSVCGATTSCGWVNTYERKDGRTVKGFCRTSSRGKSKASTNAQTKIDLKAKGTSNIAGNGGR